jgi:hypothetical protein
MKTIPAFLEEFGGALKLSGARRRRVLAEAHDHLADARERGIRAGLEPARAEAAAVEAFGEPDFLASRFEADFRTRTVGRVSSAIDAIDCWRAAHPVGGATSMIAVLAVAVVMFWSPLVAISLVPIWIENVWLGNQLSSRREPGFRRRLWTWKQEHWGRFQLVTAGTATLAFAMAVALGAVSPHHPTIGQLVFVVPVWVFVLVLNNPKPYRPSPPAG